MNAHAFDLTSEVITIGKPAFKKIQEFFHKQSGIFIPEHKQQLVVNRLRGHMHTLGFDTFDAYCNYIASTATHSERTHVVDLLTTNETYFFREPEHFTHLVKMMLPTIKHRPLRIWCAAASSGEEPYSLAMVLSDKIGHHGWELVASDISVRMLETAEQGLYRIQRMEFMPEQYLKKYCRKGTGPYDGMLIVDPEVRKRVRFVQHNLLESAAKLGNFDIIFVRNVMIYFDAEVKSQVLKHLYSQLNPGGWLVTSHSESLIGRDIPLEQIRPSIYRRTMK